MAGIPSTSAYVPPGKSNKWIAVCAVDVGTINCGYAYSFNDTKEVWLNKNWAESEGYVSMTAPSAMLLNTDGKAQDFGFQAINEFVINKTDRRLVYDGIIDPENVKFSEDEHLTLSEDEDTDTEIDKLRSSQLAGCVDSPARRTSSTSAASVRSAKAACGSQQCPALSAMVDLAYLLARDCLDQIENNYKAYRELSGVWWIFPVHHTWPIIRKAKLRRMIKKKFLQEFEPFLRRNGKSMAFMVVNTMESLSLAVRHYLPSSKQSSHRQSEKQGYLLIHAGATRMETSLNTQDGIVEMAYSELAGAYVNRLFEGHLGQHIDVLLIAEFKQRFSYFWMEFMQFFELAKKAVQFSGAKSTVEMNMSLGFGEAFTAITNRNISHYFNNGGDIRMSKSGGKLSISHQLMQELFEMVLTPLMVKVDDLISLAQQHGIQITTLVLTGGLSESEYVRDFISNYFKNEFKMDLPLVVPELPSMILAKGAVLKSKIFHKAKRLYALCLYDIPDPTKKSQTSKSKSSTGLNNGGKVIWKMYPLINQGEVIKIGKVFSFKTVAHCVYREQLCFQIFEFTKDSLLKNTQRSGKEFYYVDDYTIRKTVGDITRNVPQTCLGTKYLITVTIAMDRNKFLTTVELKMEDEMTKSGKKNYSTTRHSVECPYDTKEY